MSIIYIQKDIHFLCYYAKIAHFAALEYVPHGAPLFSVSDTLLHTLQIKLVLLQVSVVEPKDEAPIIEPYSEQKGATKPFDQQQQQQMM